jgi:hypothetical protein
LSKAYVGRIERLDQGHADFTSADSGSPRYISVSPTRCAYRSGRGLARRREQRAQFVCNGGADAGARVWADKGAEIAVVTFGDVVEADLVEPELRYRFLDVACGDASASARALMGTSIEHYYGVDISEPALELARRELSVLRCPITLEKSDFVAALANWTTPLDVV